MATFLIYLTLILCSYSEFNTAKTADNTAVIASCTLDNPPDHTDFDTLNSTPSIEEQHKPLLTSLTIEQTQQASALLRNSQLIRAPPSHPV